MTKLFLRFGNSLLGGLEADLRMRAVAKRFLGGSAAATKCHSFFDRIFVSIRVDQFHFARNDVGTMLDCFDFHHNANNLTLSARAASRVEFWGTHACSVSVAAFCGDELLFDSKLLGNERRPAKVRDRRMRSPTRQRRVLPRTLLAPVGVKRKLGRL